MISKHAMIGTNKDNLVMSFFAKFVFFNQYSINFSLPYTFAGAHIVRISILRACIYLCEFSDKEQFV